MLRPVIGSSRTNMIVGILSDTHGELKQDALASLSGVDHIIHAGDIGAPQIIEALKQLAPVTAVRGNTDRDFWARSLPAEEMIVLEEKPFYVLHDLHDLDLDPVAAGVQVVVSGHTHQPLIKKENGIIYFNPGTASRRWRGAPRTIGHIQICMHDLRSEIIRLDR
jgi:putative phosphoesterase